MNNLKDKSVVLIGGGTGTSQFLCSLKAYTDKITAIVTVGDDGGSSGLMRREFGVLPPGDIRNCLVALSEDENIMAELMDVRFSEGLFKKQSLGNLIIAAMTQISGNFPLAVKRLGEVLNIRGNVYPVSTTPITLTAVTGNNKKIRGESFITRYCGRNGVKIEHIEITPCDAVILPECASAIEKADIIVYCPGSLYTSLIPNLLVCGMCDVLSRTKAKKYYITNIMTECGETTDYDLSDHIKAVESHSLGQSIIDCVVYNTGSISSEVLSRYRSEKSSQVKNYIAPQYIEKYSFINADFVKIENRFIRHNSDVFWKMLDCENI